jgi:hypothetical protein
VLRALLPVLAAAAVLLSACAPGAEVRAVPTVDVEPLTFEAVPGRTRIERFDPPGAGERLQLELAVLARNPNAFGVRLDRFEYRVLLADALVAEGTLEPEAWLTAGGSAPLAFPVDASLPPRRPLLTEVARAFTGEPLPYRLEGSVRFSAAGYAFDTRDALLVEDALLPRETAAPPQIRLDADASRVFEVRAGVPVVQIAASVRNPGEIGYFLNGKDVVLSLAGRPLGRLDVGPVPLPAGGERRLELLFYPDPELLDEPGRRALAAALGGTPTGFSVRGELAMDVLGVASFPVPGGFALDGFVDAD